MDYAEQRREILGGKRELEDEYGVDVTEFAYPFGYYDGSAAEVAGDAHDVVVTAETPSHGLVRPHTKPTEFPRLRGGLPHRRLRWDLTDVRWLSVRTALKRALAR